MQQEFDDCHVTVCIHAPGSKMGRTDPAAIPVIYSDDHVRVMKVFDISHPPQGRKVIRVDIFQ